jgi:DedD protein
MSLAFWRRKKIATAGSSSRSPRSASSDDDSGVRADPTAALRVRARRRLIGAAALLLAVIIVVPMVLDPEPKPVPDNIPIDIPSEKTKFTPRLALPPVPAPENVPLAPPADAPPPATAPATLAPADAAKGKPATGAEAIKAEEQRARAALEGKATVDKPVVAAKGGKFAVQAAATANEAAAREMSEQLKKAGLAAYTERHETTEGVLFRVRVGPYATREEAEQARARLKSLGISANVVTS